MMMMRNFFFWLAILGLTASLFFLAARQVKLERTLERENARNAELSERSAIQYVSIGGRNVRVDVALLSEELARGLSGRGLLPEGEGMLFIFPEPGKYVFWMKDMNFAIDIIWITDDLKVAYIKKGARPESYPEIFGSDVEARYVLEVPAGFSEKNNWRAGDSVEFKY